jgi:hypothetical protein
MPITHLVHRCQQLFLLGAGMLPCFTHGGLNIIYRLYVGMEVDNLFSAMQAAQQLQNQWHTCCAAINFHGQQT